MLENKNILLIVSGGIAAYKTPELIRLMKKAGAHVRCILTEGGGQFVTPLSLSTLSEEPVYTELFSLKDEREMGHIRLSREADLIVVAPASADILAKMTQGIADDLASTTLLASDKPILIAPAMNPEMWHNEATQANVKTLLERGAIQSGPTHGDTACGESGQGRMSEPEEIFESIMSFFYDRPLKGLKALVTAGPTFEPLDPVRFIGNRSSGKQGYAIANALYEAGASVTLVSGPTALPAPAGLQTIRVETAQQMLEACEKALPTDIAVCAAAVGDWAPLTFEDHKIKKQDQSGPPVITLKENPDILKTLARHKNRPNLLIGFAAETQDLERNARAKLKSKGCDWILANNVGAGEKIFGADENHVYFITKMKIENWNRASKKVIARKISKEIVDFFITKKQDSHAAE